jgi:UDP-N-acetyl-2-amino-2-deoxyglucuronate dehydrogenase
VAVCDTEAAALAAAVQRTGARGYASYTQMLEQAAADCVVLATPSGQHARRRPSRPHRPAGM